jgi:NDP-sugar pyrophosphorylase family protein
MHAIVIAGGKGTRLGHLTASTPKALMRFGAYSLLEITLIRLRQAGADLVTLCVSHLSEAIEREIGTGEDFGLHVDYCHDPGLLGTAGPLRGVSRWTEPALVMNCDLLTALDFGALFDAHLGSGRKLTVATQSRDVVVPFGVVQFTANGEVEAVREKPALPFDVSCGMYVVDPSVRTLIPPDTGMDMPDLMQALLEGGHRIGAYPFADDWHDIGNPESYRTAQANFAAEPSAYLRPVLDSRAVTNG